MAPALRRHLQDLPWIGDGLSLTQRLALEALRAGPRAVAALFRTTQLESEPLPFLGDLMFWAVLREMQRVAEPPFAVTNEQANWPQQILSLTPAGQALLAGGSDWLAAQPPVRWVGGVRIAPGGSGWRWSGADGRPVQA